MIITKEKIFNFEKIYRTNLINSISGFKSASLIGTVDSDRNNNLAIFNSVIHVGANPPLLGFLMRPVSVERHTYNNIKQMRYFTINHVNENITKNAHQTSASYDKEKSEFLECGLTPEFSRNIIAPYVKESNIKIGLKFIEEQEIKSNGTIFIIGEIMEIIIPDIVLEQDGYINIEKAGTVAIGGLDGYYNTKKIARYSYAKPGDELKEL